MANRRIKCHYFVIKLWFNGLNIYGDRSRIMLMYYKSSIIITVMQGGKKCTCMFINYRYMTTILPHILTCDTRRFVLHDLLVSKSLSNINPDNEAIHLKNGRLVSRTQQYKQSLCNRFHGDTVSFYFTLGLTSSVIFH